MKASEFLKGKGCLKRLFDNLKGELRTICPSNPCIQSLRSKDNGEKPLQLGPIRTENAQQHSIQTDPIP
ncbi:unnamed protein product [Rotaria sordida]|uniref:Uncharacterized protein n=1 Tax=Rotaria sordida TaxID=392033 RepID=A0A815SBN7_9BILA|nr:unnamed protein product [Rotaria sordida]